MAISHDCGALNFSKFFEELCKVLICEAGIFWEALHVDVVEGAPRCLTLLALILQYREQASDAIAVC